jgi:HK97 family phage prohead protease
MEDGHPIHIRKQLEDLEVRDEDSRQFQGFASVEVKDRDGDIVPVDELMKAFRTFMRRNGNIHDQHSNRTVGKVLNFQPKDRETDDGEAPGILITGEIFNDHPADDRVWNKIKDGEMSGLSIGAEVEDTEYDEEHDADKLRNPFLHELSVVTEPANQYADITAVNAVAKSSDHKRIFLAGKTSNGDNVYKEARPRSKDEDLDGNPCWEGYEPAEDDPLKPDGQGGFVPNCVPKHLQRETSDEGDTMTQDKDQEGDDAASTEDLSKEDLMKRIEQLEEKLEEDDNDTSKEDMTVADAMDEAEESLPDAVFETLVDAVRGDGEDKEEHDEEDMDEKLQKSVDEAVEKYLGDAEVTKTGRPDGAADSPSNSDAVEKDGGDEDDESNDVIKSPSDVEPNDALKVARGEKDVDKLELEKQRHQQKREQIKKAIGKE